MSLKKQYITEVIPRIKKELKIKNQYAVPKILKITVNVGIGSYVLKNKDYADVVKNITTITGQKPIVTKARKAISNFKLRKGMPVGVCVTLRKNRMYHFLDKLINVVCPRIRDFRGFSKKCFDGHGNLNIGLKDYTVFPEITPTDILRGHGLQICINTTAKNDQEAIALFAAMGFPFRK